MVNGSQIPPLVSVCLAWNQGQALCLATGSSWRFLASTAGCLKRCVTEEVRGDRHCMNIYRL